MGALEPGIRLAGLAVVPLCPFFGKRWIHIRRLQPRIDIDLAGYSPTLTLWPLFRALFGFVLLRLG